MKEAHLNVYRGGNSKYTALSKRQNQRVESSVVATDPRRERCRGEAWEVYEVVKLFCMKLPWWTRDVSPWWKSIVCVGGGGSPVAQCIKLPLLILTSYIKVPISHIGAQVCILTDPANVPGNAMEDGPSIWPLATHVGILGGIPGSWILSGLASVTANF